MLLSAVWPAFSGRKAVDGRRDGSHGAVYGFCAPPGLHWAAGTVFCQHSTNVTTGVLTVIWVDRGMGAPRTPSRHVARTRLATTAIMAMMALQARTVLYL